MRDDERLLEPVGGLQFLALACLMLNRLLTVDEPVAEAIELVAAKRDGDRLWPLATRYPGAMPVELDAGAGQPSRWNTLRALRILRCYERADA